MRSLGEPIAGTENLFSWGEGQILKLHGEETPREWVAYLSRLDRTLYEAGLPVPEAGEIIEVNGRLGQIYERIEGPTLAEELLKTAKENADGAVELGELFAEVHAEVHSYGNIPGVLTQRQILPGAIGRLAILSEDLAEKTLIALESMPHGDRLCHGDFHPYNVLMSQRGPVVIDWNNAHLGNPLEDVARSRLILSGAPISEDAFDSALVDRFAQGYLARYFTLRPDDLEQLDGWRPIVAAVRLCDDIPELEGWLLSQIRSAFGSEEG